MPRRSPPAKKPRRRRHRSPEKQTAANDDRARVDAALARGSARGGASSLLAYGASAVWVALGILMMINGVATAGVVSFLTSTAAFATVAATIAPVMVFLAVAGMARRSEELRSASLAMSDIAVRLTEPEINATEGVVNIVHGDGAVVGQALAAHPDVDKVAFTGSTDTGKRIVEAAKGNLKKVSMELGGNAPFIVFDDADLDAAVEGAMMCKFRNNGQTCVCANRIYVQAGVYDQFAEKLQKAVSNLKIGDGLEEGTTLGPLINAAAIEKVQEHVTDATSKGAHVLMGGGEARQGEGYFLPPTILTDVTQDMMVSHDETFGPLAPLFKFEDEDAVIDMANDTIFGLASYFYARDLSRVYKVAEALEYGIVGVNTGIISTEVGPFGGVKQSGLGREGSHHGVEDYLEMKYICTSI